MSGFHFRSFSGTRVNSEGHSWQLQSCTKTIRMSQTLVITVPLPTTLQDLLLELAMEVFNASISWSQTHLFRFLPSPRIRITVLLRIYTPSIARGKTSRGPQELHPCWSCLIYSWSITVLALISDISFCKSETFFSYLVKEIACRT